jgi:hypothetical protein
MKKNNVIENIEFPQNTLRLVCLKRGLIFISN